MLTFGIPVIIIPSLLASLVNLLLLIVFALLLPLLLDGFPVGVLHLLFVSLVHPFLLTGDMLVVLLIDGSY